MDAKKLRPFSRALREAARLADDIGSIDAEHKVAEVQEELRRLSDEFSQSLATVKRMLAEIDAP